LEAALHPRQVLAPISASPEDFDLVARSVQARYPDRQIVGFSRAGVRADESIQVRMTDAASPGHAINIQDKRFDSNRDAHLIVFVNQRTGEILGDRPYWDLMQLVYWFHAELLGPFMGRGYLGIIGFTILFLSVTGLIYWWPRVGRWAAAFRVATTRGRNRLLRDLHAVSGAIVAIALILSSLTGVFMCYESAIMTVFRAWGFARTTIPPPPQSKAGRPGRPITVGAAVHVAQHAFPDYFPASITVPLSGSQRYQVEMMPLHDSRVWWTVEATIDASSGALLGTFDPHTQPAGNSVVLWVIFFHNGQMFGWPGRVLVMLEGLALAGLCVTGPWLWLIRRGALGSLPQRIKAEKNVLAA
jgi:uncharacterized iron-regulated membrane protein